MATTTTGWHRVGEVTTRAPFGVEQQVVPGARIFVTSTATGAAATIFTDPGMSIPIPGSVVTADIYGSYDYYLPLNYCVTEKVSSPDGSLVTTTNLAHNGPLATALTTTNNVSDIVTLAGILTTSHVSLQPTNSAAASMYASTYVSSKSTGSITVTHPASAGATFDVIITTY